MSLLLVAGLAVRMALYFQRLDLGFEPRDPVTLKARKREAMAFELAAAHAHARGERAEAKR